MTIAVGLSSALSEGIMAEIHIIGGGLAGSEAAWQAAEANVSVTLHEMRPVRMTEAHATEGLAELVCSNSLRSDDWENNAVGLLHERCGAPARLSCARPTRISCRREERWPSTEWVFSAAVQSALEGHPNIRIMREEIADPPQDWDNVIVATGL
jgi:methylenetetrahydrofolate--tRNA-(uracil-5-)-methyltransferase